MVLGTVEIIISFIAGAITRRTGKSLRVDLGERLCHRIVGAHGLEFHTSESPCVEYNTA